MTAGLLSGQGMPTREGDLSVEGHGMDPIPASSRYGSVTRVFTVWFTPNLVPAAFFLGTLAAASFIGLGFWTSLAAIIVGNLVGSVLVNFRIEDTYIEVEAQVDTVDRTGVEMEALTACSIAALTIYDMCKSADRSMVLGDIALWEKTGGRSGSYRRALELDDDALGI